MITTTSINGRDDWYQAFALVCGRTYFAFEKTRHSAFMEVARQLAAKGFIKW